MKIVETVNILKKIAGSNKLPMSAEVLAKLPLDDKIKLSELALSFIRPDSRIPIIFGE